MRTAKTAPSAWRDVRRDWQSWSTWERRAATLGFGALSATMAYMLLGLAG
jgi:hypothetical protein